MVLSEFTRRQVERPAVYLFGVGDAAHPYRSGHRAAGYRPPLAMAFQVTFRAVARRYLHHARELQLPLPVDDEPVGVVAADFVAMDVAEVNPSWGGSESNTRLSALARALSLQFSPGRSLRSSAIAMRLVERISLFAMWT